MAGRTPARRGRSRRLGRSRRPGWPRGPSDPGPDGGHGRAAGLAGGGRPRRAGAWLPGSGRPGAHSVRLAGLVPGTKVLRCRPALDAVRSCVLSVRRRSVVVVAVRSPRTVPARRCHTRLGPRPSPCMKARDRGSRLIARGPGRSRPAPRGPGRQALLEGVGQLGAQAGRRPPADDPAGEPVHDEDDVHAPGPGSDTR